MKNVNSSLQTIVLGGDHSRSGSCTGWSETYTLFPEILKSHFETWILILWQLVNVDILVHQKRVIVNISKTKYQQYQHKCKNVDKLLITALKEILNDFIKGYEGSVTKINSLKTLTTFRILYVIFSYVEEYFYVLVIFVYSSFNIS